MSSEKIISHLISQGVEAFVVCAGSRNFPLIEEITSNGQRPVFHHFEEREAAFFALGLSKRCKKPVAVVTTSGTAVAETLPACIEAYYSGIPLVVISADRPVRFRSTGAPQAIEQSDLLQPYTALRFDISYEMAATVEIHPRFPTHINVCIEESEIMPTTHGVNSIPVKKVFSQLVSDDDEKHFIQFLSSVKRPVLIIGSLDPFARGVVTAFALQLNAPVYAEALSGLRESKELSSLLLKGGEKMLSRGKFDSVLRLGGVPTVRFWREIEERQLQAFSIDDKPFSGTPNSSLLSCELLDLIPSLLQKGFPKFERDELLFKTDEKTSKEIHSLIYQYPKAEPSLFYQLSHVVHEHDLLYLGNSLPIREWELAASRKRPHKIVSANRGANGIDGQLSTFLGTVDPMRHNWGVFGDLTSLYGLSSLYMIPQLPEVSFTIAIINNGGGKIFERVPSLRGKIDNPAFEKMLLNKHEISFEHFASLWGAAYQRGDEFLPEYRRSGTHVLEIRPNIPQTKAFWRDWDKFWEAM